MTNLAGLAQLAARDLQASGLRSTISAAGIGLGVAVLIVVAGLGLGTRDVILNEVVSQLPINTIEVIPKSVDLGLFKTGALLGGVALDPKTAAALGELDAVESVYPKLQVKLPMGARGGARIFGRRLYTDLFMIGIPPALLRQEVPDFRDDPGVVPVVISDQLIEVYNTSIAPAMGTPKLTGETLGGFEFEITLGRSLMLGSRGARSAGVERARVVGVSRYALRLGVTVPIETARRLLRKYGDPIAAETYSAILLRAKAPTDVPAITKAVRAMGLDVDQAAERTADLLSIATLLAALVGLLVLVLAGLNIAHGFVATLNERRRELAILRAVGARRRDLLTLVQIQAVMLGIGGGLIGVLAARLGCFGIDGLAAALVPDFPFKPDSFFVLPLWLDGAGFAAGIVAASLGSLGPAVRAARSPVAAALAEG